MFQNTMVSVFEMNIRFVGGLLSAYALTKDEVSSGHIFAKAFEKCSPILIFFVKGGGHMFIFLSRKFLLDHHKVVFCNA